MTHPPATHWRRLRSSLRFHIGPRALWYWRFDAYADERHFIDLPATEGLPEFPTLPGAPANAYILRAHPVEAPPSRIRLAGGHLVYTQKTFRNHYVDLALPGGFAAYLQRFSAKSRSTLKRKIRRFAERSKNGQIDWRAYRTPEEMADFLQTASRLAARTYQSRVLNEALPTSSVFKQSAIQWAGLGQARGFILFLDERPAAYVFSRCRDGVIGYDFVGYEPDFNALSPGTVLQYLILERLFDEPGVRVFDFTEGDGGHKAFFATDSRLCAKIIVFRSVFPAIVPVSLHCLFDWMNQAIDWMAVRLSLTGRLRRFVRQGPPPVSPAAAVEEAD